MKTILITFVTIVTLLISGTPAQANVPSNAWHRHQAEKCYHRFPHHVPHYARHWSRAQWKIFCNMTAE